MLPPIIDRNLIQCVTSNKTNLHTWKVFSCERIDVLGKVSPWVLTGHFQLLWIDIPGCINTVAWLWKMSDVYFESNSAVHSLNPAGKTLVQKQASDATSSWCALPLNTYITFRHSQGKCCNDRNVPSISQNVDSTKCPINVFRVEQRLGKVHYSLRNQDARKWGAIRAVDWAESNDQPNNHIVSIRTSDRFAASSAVRIWVWDSSIICGASDSLFQYLRDWIRFYCRSCLLVVLGGCLEMLYESRF